jgi:hypothetical protein
MAAAVSDRSDIKSDPKIDEFPVDEAVDKGMGYSADSLAHRTKLRVSQSLA